MGFFFLKVAANPTAKTVKPSELKMFTDALLGMDALLPSENLAHSQGNIV